MNVYRHAESVMGTVVSFDLRGNSSATSAQASIAEVAQWLHWVDSTFSTYKPESDICRLDRGELTVEQCHPDVRTILDLCDELTATTNGYFDPRAGDHLDPSGVVKGWAVEQGSTMLVELGWPDHALDGGGDIRLRGHCGEGRPWHVAINHPYRVDAYCALLAIDEGAVATSGTYLRGFHVIDPHRHQPATALASVTVIGGDLTLTDAYATAALAMGHEARSWLEALPDHESLVIDAEGNSWSTPGFDSHRFESRLAS